MSRFLPMLLAAAALFLTAAEPVVIIQQDGTAVYWDGESSTASPIRVIRVTGDPQPPGPPTDGDDPDDPPRPTSLTERVTAWAEAVDDPAGAVLWSRVYGMVAAAIGDARNPSADDMATLLRDATKATLDLMDSDSRAKWASVDKQIERALTERLITGSGAASPAEWVKALTEVESGFDAVASLREAAAIDGDVIDRIERLIAIVLRLILIFRGL